MFHKEVKPSHSKEHEQGVGASILREADVISHESQGEGTGEGNGRRERSCKEIEHGDREGSEDQGDDPEVSFGLGKRIELMGEDEEERRMKKRWILLVEFDLSFEVIPGIIVGMHFVHPQGFLVKGVKPQTEPNDEAENKDENFFLF